jgi:hypothetical protein
MHPEYSKRLAQSLQDYGKKIQSSGTALRNYKDDAENLSKTLTNLEGHLLNIGDVFSSKLVSPQKPSFFKDLFSHYKDLNSTARQLMWTGFSMLMAFRPIVSGIEQAFNSVAQYGLETQWFAERLGMSTQNIQALRVALAYSNENIDHFATSLAVLSRKVYDAAHGSGVGVRALQELGIQVTDVNGKMLPFEEILGQLIARIQALKEAGVSSAQISAYLTKIFGRENTRLALFLAENIDKITERLNKAKIFGLIFGEQDQATANRLMEALNDMRFAWEGFVKQMIVGAAGVFIPLINWIRDYVVAFTKLGSAFRGVGGIIIDVLFVIAKVAVVAATSLLIVAGVMRGFIVLQGVLMALRNVIMGAAGAVTVFGVSMGPVALIIVGLLTVLGLLIPQFLGVGKAFKEASKGSSDFLKDMQETFKTFSDLARDAGEDFMDSYAEGMKAGFPYARKVALEIAEELFQYFGGGHSPAVKGPLANLEYWGADFIEAYREGMKDEVPNILSDVQNIGKGIVSIFNSIPQMVKGIGGIVDSWAYSIGQRLALSATGKTPFDFQFILNYLQQIPYYLYLSIKDVVNNFQNTLTNSFTSIIDKLIKSFEKLGDMDNPQSFLQKLGKGFFDTIGAVEKSEIGNFLQSVFAPVYGLIDTFFGNLMSGKLLNQLTDWARQQISAISAQREFISVISSAFSNAHATGTITTQPHLALVGEEGPEAIIPLSSHRRKRALQLWIETGKKLGVVGYAEGGIVGGTVENLEDWVRALGSILINAGNAFRTGILAAIERWENTIRDLPKKIDIDRKIEIPEVKRQTEILSTIRFSLVNIGGVLNIIEKHLSNINATASEQTLTVKKQIDLMKEPQAISKVLSEVKTNDVNFLELKVKFAKLMVAQQDKFNTNPFKVDYSALLKTGIPQLIGMKESLDDARAFKIKFETILTTVNEKLGKYKDVAPEYPQSVSIVNQKPTSIYNLGPDQIEATSKKSVLNQESPEVKLFRILKGYIAEELSKNYKGKKWEELDKDEQANILYKAFQTLSDDMKQAFYKLFPQDTFSSYQDFINSLSSFRYTNKVLYEAAEEIKKIPQNLEQGSTPTITSDIQLNANNIDFKSLSIPEEIFPQFLKLVESPLASIKSASSIFDDIKKEFATTGKGYQNLRSSIDNLLKQRQDNETTFRTGSITP